VTIHLQVGVHVNMLTVVGALLPN